MNPANLTLRFVLELVTLGALAYWGWSLADSWWRWLAASAVVLAFAILWGGLVVPNDPSRGEQHETPRGQFRERVRT